MAGGRVLSHLPPPPPLSPSPDSAGPTPRSLRYPTYSGVVVIERQDPDNNVRKVELGTLGNRPGDRVHCVVCGSHSHVEQACPRVYAGRGEKYSCEEILFPEKHLQAQLIARDDAEHIASLDIQLDMVWRDAEHFSHGRGEEQSIISSWVGNLAPSPSASSDRTYIHTATLDSDSERVQRLLEPQTVSQLGAKSTLHYATWDFKGPFTGENVMTPKDHDPYTTQIHLVRDLLRDPGTDKVKIHFFTAYGGDAFQPHMDNLDHCLAEQWDSVNDAPACLDKYLTAQGRVNVQLGAPAQNKSKTVPNYDLEPSNSFKSIDEYTLVQYHMANASYDHVKEERREVSTRAFILSLGPTRDRHLPSSVIAIERRPQLQLTQVGTTEVCFHHLHRPVTADFIVQPAWAAAQAGGSRYDYGLLKWSKEDADDPAIQNWLQRKAVPMDENLNTLESILLTRQCVKDKHAIVCSVQPMPPRKHINRSVNGMRHGYENHEKFAIEKQFLLANDFESLPHYDFLDSFLGDDVSRDDIQRVEEQEMEGLRDDQKRVIEGLRDMPGYQMMVYGGGGTGKSHVSRKASRLAMKLAALHGEPGNVWITSTINANCDQHALALQQDLEDLAAEDPENFAHQFVIRAYSDMTEQQELKKNFRRRNKQRRDKDKEDDITAEEQHHHDDLHWVWQVRELTGKLSFDARFKLQQLSENEQLLNFLGVRDKDGNLSPICRDEARWSDTRSLIKKWITDPNLDVVERRAAIQAYKTAKIALYKAAAAVVGTPDLIGQPRNYLSVMPPRLLISDEMGKEDEDLTYAKYVLARGVTGDGGVLSEHPVPHIMLGDIGQPPPKEKLVEGDPYYRFSGSSVFRRAILAGFPAHELTGNRRTCEDICNLLNHVSRGRKNDPDPPPEEIEMGERLAAAMEPIFGREGNIFVVTMRSKAETVRNGTSRYNMKSLDMLLYLVARLLVAKWKPSDEEDEVHIDPSFIGALTFYLEQSDRALTGRQAFLDWLKALDPTDREKFDLPENFEERYSRVFFGTLDKFQGGEKRIVIMDRTASGRLGFTAIYDRLMLALGRAKSILIMIEDIEAAKMEMGARYHTSPYGRAMNYLESNGCVIDADAAGLYRDDLLPDLVRNVLSTLEDPYIPMPVECDDTSSDEGDGSDKEEALTNELELISDDDIPLAEVTKEELENFYALAKTEGFKKVEFGAKWVWLFEIACSETTSTCLRGCGTGAGKSGFECWACHDYFCSSACSLPSGGPKVRHGDACLHEYELRRFVKIQRSKK